MLALAVIVTILTSLGLAAKAIYILTDHATSSPAVAFVTILIHLLTHGFTITATWVLYANTGVA